MNYNNLCLKCRYNIEEVRMSRSGKYGKNIEWSNSIML